MPCESCAVQFSVFKRKRVCYECERYYCSGCLRRGGGMCAPCRVLSARPLARASIAHLKVRDLQCFLQRQNVSTRGCVEKDELLSLCVSHVNSAAYRRRGSRNSNSTFTLKGFTNNINEFINSAFDIRPSGAQPAPANPVQPQQGTGCCNTAHVHMVRPTPQPRSHIDIRQERFSVTPGGERDVRVPPDPSGGSGGEAEGGAGGVSRASSHESTRVDSGDCFEIEDIDDAGWEFVIRPADPLPIDSEVLLTAADGAAQPVPPVPPRPLHTIASEHIDPGVSSSAGAAGLRAASSELELRSAASPSAGSDADAASLQDEPLMDADHHSLHSTPPLVTLESLREPAQLQALSVRQLKELLTRNRVEYRGCLERADLLTRAKMLYDDHAHYRDEMDNLPIEECCKICMAAPLECVLLECGHIAACTACSKQLAECPICRQYVVRAVRCFRS